MSSLTFALPTGRSVVMAIDTETPAVANAAARFRAQTFSCSVLTNSPAMARCSASSTCENGNNKRPPNRSGRRPHFA